MTSYACTDFQCPQRAPVPAAAPPLCYTCGKPMAAAWIPTVTSGVPSVVPLGGSGTADVTYATEQRMLKKESSALVDVPSEPDYSPENVTLSFRGIPIVGPMAADYFTAEP